MRDLLKDKMKYWWTAFYCPLYLICFYIVEHLDRKINIISIDMDHKIPFCEYFVVPYLMWFPYIIGAFIIFFFKDKEEFLDFIKYLYMGMTVFIVVSFIFPNGLNLRPDSFERNNIFTQLVGMLYKSDTATNVTPSIHAYNSIVVMVAAIRSKKVFTRNWQKIFCSILSVLIIASTLFIKQHSIVDVIAALALAFAGYMMFYYEHDGILQKIYCKSGQYNAKIRKA